MKNFKLLYFIFLLALSSCQTPSYMFVEGQRTGVDFTSGKWLLNEIDCPKNSRDKLTSETMKFFKKSVGDRVFYINDVNGLLIARKIPLKPNSVKLKELKDGTGFDFFINITTRKNKSDFSSVEVYQDNSDSGKNEASVILEIYDLNLKQIIYSQNVVGMTRKGDANSTSYGEKSGKLIDNIALYKTSDNLMMGALKRIFKDLEKRSVK
jgi:hypothetical protein